MDPTLDDDGQPSCSAAAALERQEPFINSTLAQHALALLARLFRYGEISYHGGFINLAKGGLVLRIDPQYWKRNPEVEQAIQQGLMRAQEEGSNGRANEGRAYGPDCRA